MNVIEAIYARQSVGNVKPDEIPRADIEVAARGQAPEPL
jgi:hypothetical protein